MSTFNESDVRRQKAGQPTGGQFAEKERGASGLSLTPPTELIGVKHVRAKRLGGMSPGRPSQRYWAVELTNRESVNIYEDQLPEDATHAVVWEERGKDAVWFGHTEGASSREEAEELVSGLDAGRAVIVELGRS